MDDKRIHLRMLANPDLNGELLHRLHGAPITCGGFNSNTEATRIRSVAVQTQLQLMVRVSSVIAEQLDTLRRGAYEKIRVAIAVKVGCHEKVNRALDRLRQT